MSADWRRCSTTPQLAKGRRPVHTGWTASGAHHPPGDTGGEGAAEKTRTRSCIHHACKTVAILPALLIEITRATTFLLHFTIRQGIA
jgi:hypothetical protein